MTTLGPISSRLAKPPLQQTLEETERAGFCVAYFNLRGWKRLDRFIERWAGGAGHCCRLLVGMQRLSAEEWRTALSMCRHEEEIDNQTALRLQRRLAEAFDHRDAFGSISCTLLHSFWAARRRLRKM